MQKTSRLSAQSLNSSKNLNFVDKQGIIHNIYIGDQTGSKFRSSIKELKGLIDKMRQQNKLVLVLTDIRELGRISLQARREGIEVMRKFDVDKVGIFGGNVKAQELVNLMLKVSGMGYKMRLFETEQEALNWLHEKYR